MRYFDTLEDRMKKMECEMTTFKQSLPGQRSSEQRNRELQLEDMNGDRYEGFHLKEFPETEECDAMENSMVGERLQSLIQIKFCCESARGAQQSCESQ